MNVRITWDTLKARKIICEKYYQLKHPTMVDKEIKDEWLRLGVPESTCNQYIRKFRARIGAGKLTRNQARNFLAFYYFLTSSHMNEKEITQEWGRIGFTHTKREFWALKIDGEWRDKLKAGHVNVFEEEPKKIVNESQQLDICENIYAKRRAGITDDDIKRVWWNMGVSDSMSEYYMEICSQKYSSIIKARETGDVNTEVRQETVNSTTSSPGTQDVELDSDDENLDFLPLLLGLRPNFSVEIPRLTLQQAENFLVTYYFSISPWMSDENIIEAWNKLGFPLSECCKYLHRFKSKEEWKKNLQAGQVSIFESYKRIFDLPEQIDVCRFIFSHRKENVGEEDLRKVWLSFGIPSSLCSEYLNEFRSVELHGQKYHQKSADEGHSPLMIEKSRESAIGEDFMDEVTISYYFNY